MPTSKKQSTTTTSSAPAATQKPFKGSYSLLPAEATQAKCEGTGQGEKPHKLGAVLPRKSFPTTTGPDRRTAECRSCRDHRQGRAEKRAERVQAEAKAKAVAARQAKRQGASSPKVRKPRTTKVVAA